MKKKFPLLLCVIGLRAIAAVAQVPTDIWISTTSGNWSDGTRWLDGTAPPIGGGATQILEFDASGATAYTATNDRGNPFSLNGYIFNSSSSGLISLANASSNALTFVANGGTNPTITQIGSGAATIDQSMTVNAPLTIGGTGTGTLTLSAGGGVRAMTLGSNTLTINTNSFLTQLNIKVNSSTGGSIVKNGTNTLVLNTSTNTFNGGLTLNAGNLNLSQNSNTFTSGVLTSGALGVGTLTLAGGKIQSSTGTARTIANKVTITGDVAFGSTTTQTGSLTFDAINGYATPPTNPFTLGGAGNSQRTLTVNVATTFLGAITETNAQTGIIKMGAGTLTFGQNAVDVYSNTYTGMTTVNEGELDLAKSGGPVAIAGDLTIGDGIGVDVVKLVLGDQIADTSILTFNGTGSNAGIFRLNAGDTVGGLASTGGAGIIEAGSGFGPTLTVDVNATNRSFAGIIRDGGAFSPLSLTKMGNAVQTLTGSNTFTGGTAIIAGTLEAGANGALGSGTTGTTSIQVHNSGTLLLSNASATDRIRDDALITLGGVGSGTPSITRAGGGSEGSGSAIGLGALTLAVNSSLNYGGATVGNGTLTFGGGNTANPFIPDTFTLSVLGYDGVFGTSIAGVDGTNDRLIFSADESANLGHFSFINPDGLIGTFDADQINLGNGFFEIVPVPEPATSATALLVVAALGYMQRERLKRCSSAWRRSSRLERV